MPPIIVKPDGIILKVHVQPKASNNAIVGVHNDAVKIRLTAPPVEGAANDMCVKFLAKQLGIPKSSIEIISGHTSRFKQLFIHFTSKDSSSHAGQSESMLNLLEKLVHPKKP